MSQEALNSANNINLPHNISMWFQQDWSGEYYEFGDLVVDAVTLSPEFQDHRSYRNGINALRKRLNSVRAATITATLNEPNMRNLQRVLFGGTIGSSQSFTVLEGKHLTVTSGLIDMSDANESDFGNITVTGVYAAEDFLEASNLISGDLTCNTDGQVDVGATDFADGTIVYVRYEVAVSSLYSSEIFGATSTTIEGAVKLQARNLQGGVVQLWDIASAHLAPNGDLTYALENIQTVPIILTLQERSGTFGTIYVK